MAYIWNMLLEMQDTFSDDGIWAEIGPGLCKYNDKKNKKNELAKRFLKDAAQIGVLREILYIVNK